MPVWNPDVPDDNDYLAQWNDVPDTESYDNGFKAQWQLFLAHAAQGKPFRGTWPQGARGVQVAELALRSSAECRRIDVPALEACDVTTGRIFWGGGGPAARSTPSPAQ